MCLSTVFLPIKLLYYEVVTHKKNDPGEPGRKKVNP